MRRLSVPKVLAGAGVLGGLALLVGVPVGRLIAVVVEDGAASLSSAASAPGFATGIGHSLLVGVVASALAVPGGTAVAIALRRPEVPARRILRALIFLPLLVPQFVLGFSWSQAYGPAGLTDQAAGFTVPGLLGGAGVCLVLAASLLPLAALVISAALATRTDPDLERAARAAGASPWQAFRTVTLPLLRLPLLGTFALVFVAAVDSFAVPAALGTPGGFSTMTTRIYADLNQASDPTSFDQALLLALLLAMIALAALVPAGLAFGRSRPAVHTEQPRDFPSRRSRSSYLIAASIWCYLALAAFVPLLALVLSALDRAVGLPATPGNWTLANFSDALANPALPAFGRSVLLAAAAATLGLVLGGLVASLGRARSGHLIGWGVMVTFALPGSVLAVGIQLAYGKWLTNTLLIILVAYLAKFWALSYRPVAGAMDGLAPDDLLAARASGAGPLAAARTVLLPPLTPALAGAWLLVFVFALHELTMSSLLYGPGTQTLAVVILNLQQLGSTGATSALAVLLTIVLAVAAAPLLVIRHRRAPSRIVAPELEPARA